MRDGVEVFRQIGINHVSVAPADQPVHFLDGIDPAAAGPITVSCVLKVRLEDRFQHKLGGGLHHPIPDRRDTERAFAAPRLRDHHPPHRCRPVRLLGQFLPQTRQPFLNARLLDRRKGFPVHAWCSRIGAGKLIGVLQDVFPANLVVEQIEAVGRLCLRLAIELPLKVPDLYRCCQAHCQSPDPLRLQKRTRSQGPFLHRHYPASAVLRPCPPPAAAAAQGGVEAATLAATGLPRLPATPFQRAEPNTPVDRSRGICRLPPRCTRPSPIHRRVGVHDFTFEACSGFTRVTARWIAQPPKAAFVTRLRPGQLPNRAACQLPELPTSLRVDSSSTGVTRLRGALWIPGSPLRGAPE